MKKRNAILTVALLGFALAACNKNQTSTNGGAPPAVPVETQMRAAYGFAAQLPANTESYVGFYQLGKMWSDFKHSKTWAAIKANPLIMEKLGDPSFQQAKSQMNTNEEAVKWKAILKEALGSETFVAFAPGSGEKLHVWLEVNGAIRGARIQGLIDGKGANNPSAMLQAILPYAKDIDIPPTLLGFKITSQKAALDAELANAEKNLPPFVESGTFTLGANQPFNSIAVTVGKALSPDQQAAMQKVIAANISDPQKADETYQALLARRLEIAYGYMGDYFIISLGADHAHLKFAANYGDSLLARPEVQAAANYTGKPVVSFAWSSAEILAACQQEFRLMAIYDEVKQKAAEIYSQSDIEKLETDLKRIDGETVTVLHHDFTPAVGVIYRDHGLHGETFGGIKRNAASTLKFTQVPTDSTFFWVDQMGNQAFADALRTWFEDVSATAYDTFVRLRLPSLPDDKRTQFTMFQTVALPKLLEFYKISRDQFAKSLGFEGAIALDLDGEIPDIPMAVPPALHAGGRMPRIAYLSDVRDRALLAGSWDSYYKLAGEILQMTPQAAMFPNGLPQPTSSVTDGVALWYYVLPMPTGDLLPNVAVTDKTFVIGTSRSYSLEITKAAAKPVTEARPLTLDFRVNFKPAFDFADKWLALAGQYPELFFKSDEDKAADFKKLEPDYAALLQCLRAFDGMSVQAYEENGVPRVTSEIRWDEK